MRNIQNICLRKTYKVFKSDCMQDHLAIKLKYYENNIIAVEMVPIYNIFFTIPCKQCIQQNIFVEYVEDISKNGTILVKFVFIHLD